MIISSIFDSGMTASRAACLKRALIAVSRSERYVKCSRPRTDRYRIPAKFPICSALMTTWIRVPEYDTLREEAPWEIASFIPKALVWKGHVEPAPETAKIGEHGNEEATAVANSVIPTFEDLESMNVDDVTTPRTPSLNSEPWWEKDDSQCHGGHDDDLRTPSLCSEPFYEEGEYE